MPKKFQMDGNQVPSIQAVKWIKEKNDRNLGHLNGLKNVEGHFYKS